MTTRLGPSAASNPLKAESPGIVRTRATAMRVLLRCTLESLVGSTSNPPIPVYVTPVRQLILGSTGRRILSEVLLFHILHTRKQNVKLNLCIQRSTLSYRTLRKYLFIHWRLASGNRADLRCPTRLTMSDPLIKVPLSSPETDYSRDPHMAPGNLRSTASF